MDSLRGALPRFRRSRASVSTGNINPLDVPRQSLDTQIARSSTTSTRGSESLETDLRNEIPPSQSSLPGPPRAIAVVHPTIAEDTPGATGISTSNSGAMDAVADELPPSYDTARAPTVALTYTFSPQGFNTMLLLPPAEAPDTRPLMHISISMNCFIPTSYITTLRRGGTELGDYIGEFQMGLSQAQDTVIIGRRQKEIRFVLKQKDSRGTVWFWDAKIGNTHRRLTWEGSISETKCYLLGPSPVPPLLAQFRFQPLRPPADELPTPPSTIIVYPGAYELQDLLDHVIMSALIIERKRLTPNSRVF